MRIIIKIGLFINLILSQGFLHVEDGKIVEGNGEPILLKGFGFQNKPALKFVFLIKEGCLFDLFFCVLKGQAGEFLAEGLPT